MGDDSNQFDSSKSPAAGPAPGRTAALVDSDGGAREGGVQTVVPGCTMSFVL